MTAKEFLGYSMAQILGGLAGVVLTHFMFGQQLIQLSTRDRAELRLFASEIVATFGLLMVIALSGKRNVQAAPGAVA
ncbi:hypothetical protein, partial [Pseudomonas sp. GW460-13]|uniref:hypothetical protein n=1 Tax=Pseudomonas sp. GW460-13 TaxID=2070590 RepID=UPI002115228C